MAKHDALHRRKGRLIAQARKRYRRIYPCAGRARLEECFTAERNRLFLWFNTTDDSTHMVSVAV